MSSLKSYLAKLEACLTGLPPDAQQAVMEELRGHLEDRAAALRADGLEKEASMSEAIECFGEAKEIGAALRDVHGRGSWGEALAGMLPFLAIGLPMALGPYLPPPVWIAASYAVLLIGLGVPLIGLGVGWVKGFPRWSYPYGGFALAVTSLLVASNLDRWIFSGYDVWVLFFRYVPDLADVVFYLMFNEYAIWILFFAMAVIVLLLSRLWRPLRPLYQGVRHDWTRLSFGFYGVMPLALMIAFDDVTPTYRAAYLVASMVDLTAGALAYVRSARMSQRTLALLIGMTLSWAVATVGVATFWDAFFWEGQMPRRMMKLTRWHVITWGMIKDWVVLAALMFAPAILGLLRRSVKLIRAA